MSLTLRRKVWKRLRRLVRGLRDGGRFAIARARLVPASAAFALAVGVPLPAPTSPPPAEAQVILEWVKVQVAVPELTTPYRRDDWKHWTDADKDCQDSRVEVLIRAALPTTLVLSANKCTVVSGVWLDPYTGQSFRDPKQMDIDHVVPLKEASDSGAAKWDSIRRKFFANDLSTEVPQLKAVSAGANRAKGAKDVAEWLPTANVCQYVVDWVKVKQRWSLSMDAAEKARVEVVLSGCR